jgi:hypothetical protein
LTPILFLGLDKQDGIYRTLRMTMIEVTRGCDPVTPPRPFLY